MCLHVAKWRQKIQWEIEWEVNAFWMLECSFFSTVFESICSFCWNKHSTSNESVDYDKRTEKIRSTNFCVQRDSHAQFDIGQVCKSWSQHIAQMIEIFFRRLFICSDFHCNNKQQPPPINYSNLCWSTAICSLCLLCVDLQYFYFWISNRFGLCTSAFPSSVQCAHTRAFFQFKILTRKHMKIRIQALTSLPFLCLCSQSMCVWLSMNESVIAKVFNIFSLPFEYALLPTA